MARVRVFSVSVEERGGHPLRTVPCREERRSRVEVLGRERDAHGHDRRRGHGGPPTAPGLVIPSREKVFCEDVCYAALTEVEWWEATFGGLLVPNI